MDSRTKGELAFIDAYTRKILVDWCKECLLGGTFSPHGLDGSPRSAEIYLDYARSKGWVSKRDNKVTAKGFQVAASFLKG